MANFNCPNCGAALSTRLKSTKLVACDYCESTIFLEDEAVRTAGKKGVMHDRPGLLAIGKPFRYRGREYTPVGQARFDYGQGWWDEFWAIDSADGVWISVDEGDIAVERPMSIPSSDLPAADNLKTGAQIRLGQEDFIVTETGKSTCQGLRGEFPEILKPGDQYHYAHLRQGPVRLITLEFSGNEMTATEGEWLDPFEIKP